MDQKGSYVASKIKKFKANKRGRDFVVGDIHGCFTLLQEKLDSIGFDETNDRLFSVGDLVDRGPESEQCLEWLAKPFFHAVRGNHEQMAIDYMLGYSDEALYLINGGGWFLELPMEKQFEYSKAFAELPYAMEIKTKDGKVGVIHAECPVSDWADLQDAFAGENSEAFAQRAIWDRTRITYGVDSNIESIEAVFCGHTPIQAPIQLGNVFYIDTGAVFGRELTIAQFSSPQPSPLAQKPNEQSIASAYESVERSEFASRDDA